MVLLSLTLIGLVVTCAVVLGGSSRAAVARMASLPNALLVVVAGASFQVTHLVEHLLQLGYWLGHPTAVPWLTPWARSAADSLSTSAFGVEALHLVGNGIFLMAAVALVVVTAGTPRRHRAARWCLVVQGLHVAEHLALTTSVAAGGRAVGVSTLFGTLGPGPAAWTYRVVLHFVVNLVATVLALRALRGWAMSPHAA